MFCVVIYSRGYGVKLPADPSSSDGKHEASRAYPYEHKRKQLSLGYLTKHVNPAHTERVDHNLVYFGKLATIQCRRERDSARYRFIQSNGEAENLLRKSKCVFSRRVYLKP